MIFEGDTMYLFLYRVRAKSPDVAPDICRVFDHALSLFQEPGWLGGSCVVNLDDPCDVLIYEKWGSLAEMRAWLDSSARQQAHRDLEPYTDGPSRETTYRDAV